MPVQKPTLAAANMSALHHSVAAVMKRMVPERWKSPSASPRRPTTPFIFFFLFFPRLLYFRERPPRTPSPVSSPGMHERAVRKGVDAHTTASMRETDRLLTSRNGEESQQQHQQRRPAVHHPYVRSERAPCYKGAHRRWRGHPSSQHARSVTPLLLTARTCLQSLPGMMTSALSFDPHFFDPHPPKKRR